MTEQEAKLTLIEMKLQAFLEELLPDEAMSPLLALWEAAEQCPALNVTRGNPDVWAAAIAYAFARMNFLLDDDGPLHIERAEFFEFFEGCSRSTVTQKATRIEKALDFGHGHPDFCLPEVVDAMPKMVQLPNGMIVPEKLFVGELHDGREIEISLMSEEESREVEQRLAAQQREREEEKTRQRHEALRQKREEERKTQPDLFDLGD
jgi:hypothetical protein